MEMLGLSKGLCSCSCSCSATSFISSSKLHPTFQPLRRGSSCLSLHRARAYDSDEGYYTENLPAGEYGARIVVPSYEEDTKEFGEIKLECDESGCVLVMPTTKAFGRDDSSGYLRCDLTGCYFTDDPPKENGFEVIKGQKWCLGYETAPESEESFSAVIGADGWSVALTASEFNDFCQLIQTLRKGIATMDEDGFIGKDDISMQVEKGSMWVECTIPKKKVAILQNFWKLGNWGLLDNQQTSGFELRFVISGSGRRQAEGFWPAAAVMDMLKKIDATNVERSKAFGSSL